MLLARHRQLSFATPVVMGIVNVTPDSFSDGGLYADPARAFEHARRLVDEGAAIIDVGGESTRPSATPVTAQQEIDRVVPVIERIGRELDVMVSVDTSDPAVIGYVLTEADIADTIAFTVTRPRRMVVNEVLVRPTEQER